MMEFHSPGGDVRISGMSELVENRFESYWSEWQTAFEDASEEQRKNLARFFFCDGIYGCLDEGTAIDDAEEQDRIERIKSWRKRRRIPREASKALETGDMETYALKMTEYRKETSAAAEADGLIL